MKIKSNHRKLNIKIIIVLAILIMLFFIVRVVMAASILLKAEHKEGMNYINLSWNAPDTTKKWSYRLYQKTEGETEFETVSTKYNKPVKVLNIYPGVGDNLQQWMNNYGKGLISVDKVDIEEFNNNTVTYLTDTSGKYKYDVLMFGSWDKNNSLDLSDEAYLEVEKFIQSGRGVLFGHDTIINDKDKNIEEDDKKDENLEEDEEKTSNFNKLSKYTKISVNDNDEDRIYDGYGQEGSNEGIGGISTIRLMKDGYIMKYPWDIGDFEEDLFVPRTHTNYQKSNGKIWLRFNFKGTYLNSAGNFYLTTWGNTAMVQTGHNNGQATKEEQQIIANTIFSLGQITEETVASVYSAEDLEAPDEPVIYLRKLPTGEYDIKITGTDNGTTYEHYVEAKSDSGEVIKSSTIKTTVTSGIKGFSYVIGSGNTYPDDEIDVLPEYFGKENKGKLLSVKAIDNAGNVSETATILLDDEDFADAQSKGEVLLKASYEIGNNYVDLHWNAPDMERKWFYRLYQKTEGETEFETVSMRYNKHVKVLNIYPNAGNNLKSWMESSRNENGETIGKGLINVDAVNIFDFNRNPVVYLKDNQGNYKYDVLMFGSWDSNGNGYDISYNASIEVEKFIRAGRGVLFGHDTIRNDGDISMSNFNRLAHYVKITPTWDAPIYDGHDLHGNYNQGGTSTVMITKSGYLTRYPYNIGDVGTNMYVPRCHTVHQVPSGRIWLRFNYNNMYLNDPANFYLTSWGNCAMIQTGHSSGRATLDEQKIIANTLFYLAQITDETNATAYTAEDIAPPNIPKLDLSQQYGNRGVYDVKVSGRDNGTTYEHYVEAIDEEGNTVKSNITTTTVITGISGYSWVIDNNPSTEPDDIIDYTLKTVTQGQMTLYIHIKAIDGAGNVGPTLHMQLTVPEVKLYNDRYKEGMNYVPLYWTNSDGNNKYVYRLYQKAESDDTYTKVKEIDGKETNDEIAVDKEKPGLPDVIFSPIKGDSKNIKIGITANDYGTGYNHFVEAYREDTGGTFYSNDVYTVVKSGIKGYTWVIDENKTTEPSKNPKDIRELPEKLDRSYIGKWLHIRAIDNAGNSGDVLHIEIDDSRRIPEEEVDQSKYLYCIANGVHIPARDNGTQLDATVESGSLKEYIENPYKGQIIGEKYVADGMNLNNIYTDTKSHSIGKYYGEVPPKREGKEGNAKDEEVYILSYLEENDSLHSQSQLAMYAIGINEGATGADNKISLEAKEYAKYREKVDKAGGYNPSQEKLSIMVGYDEVRQKFIVGPFKIDYLRSYTKVGGEKVVFSGITGVRLYDQNGKEINGNTWTFEYDKATQIKNRSESYEEYKYPYPNEEFYLLIDEIGNEDLKEITKIEIDHQEMNGDAWYTVYEGTYNEIEWKAKYRTNKCMGGVMCPHGIANEHILGHTYYLEAETVTQGRIDSQKLIEVDWVKRYYTKHVQTLDLKLDGNGDKGDDNDDGEDDGNNPGGADDDEDKEDKIRLTMDFEGNIWNDQNENIANGIKEEGEKSVKGVRVTLYKKGESTPTTKVGSSNPTYTDEYGRYKFEQVRAGLYEIEYEYDGQTYKTTKLLANGSVQDYLSNPKKETYTNNSKAEETKEARQELNNRYYEISPIGAIGTDGKITGLEYRENGVISEIITRDGNEVSKQQYEIGINTASNRIYYPIEERKYINGVGYIKLSNQKNINIGLAEREKTNEELKLDVYESMFSIKGMSQKFAYSGRNIREKENIKDVQEYTQYINRADYEWKWDESLSGVWESPEECELEAYIDYMIIIRNEGENDIAKITELADYYSKDLMYSNDPYRDVDMTSWAVVKPEKITESESTGEETRIKVEWSESSKYGQNNQYPEYNKMYTQSLENLGIEKGKYLEVHIIFKVIKEEKGIKLDEEGEGKKNFAEVNGYRTFSKTDGSVVGLIDINSKPGDLNPRENPGLYEDDEDKAPNFKLKLDYNNGDEGGNSGDGDGTGGDGSGGNSGNIDTDEDGNPKGYGNTIEGNIWEDLRNGANTVTLSNNQVVGDGIRQRNEPLINKVRIELYETYENEKTGAKLTKKIREIRTGTELSLSNKEELEGGYRFSNLSSGKYHVEYAYGEEDQLKEEIRYNGQDYQGVKTEDIYEDEKAEGNYEEVEIMIGVDISNSMSGNPIEQEKVAVKELTKKLKEELPGVKIGIVAYNEESNMVGKLGVKEEEIEKGIDSLKAGGETSIKKAMEMMAKEYTEEGKKKIMIILTDGRPTEETNEEVIKEIEKISDEEKIELISILTKEAEQIFGTEEQPRRGKVYRITNEGIYEAIVGKIYEEIIKESEIKEDRSYGKDDEEERINQMNKFATIGIEEGEILDVNGIREMKEGKEKEEAIKKLAEETKMKAWTEDIEFRPNNTGKDKVEQINLGLRERPKVELTMEEEIVGIEVKLSDGQTIIDTEKGVNKNVNGLDKEEEKVPISIYMDEEIMQGAEIRVKYRVKIRNSGEIDKMSNYIKGGSDETITTQADYVYEYVNKNYVYRQEDQKEEDNNDIWEELEIKEVNKVADNVLKEVREENIKVLQTDGLRVELYPEGSVELETGGKTEVVGYLVLSKVISPQDEKTTLSFENSLEIVQRSNEAGRRAYRGIPGNYIPNSESEEVDNVQSRQVNITKPLGGGIPEYYVIGAIICIVIAGGIIFIKRKTK